MRSVFIQSTDAKACRLLRWSSLRERPSLLFFLGPLSYFQTFAEVLLHICTAEQLFSVLILCFLFY